MGANGNRKTALTGKRAKAARLLAEGLRFGEVVSAVGIGSTTLANWQKQPEFSQAVDDMVSAGMQQTANRLATLANEALDTLAEIAGDRDVAAQSRVSAAKTILTMTTHYRDHAVLENKLAELLQRMEVLEHAPIRR